MSEKEKEYEKAIYHDLEIAGREFRHVKREYERKLKNKGVKNKYLGKSNPFKK